jgi:hypothetical protein
MELVMMMIIRIIMARVHWNLNPKEAPKITKTIIIVIIAFVSRFVQSIRQNARMDEPRSGFFGFSPRSAALAVFSLAAVLITMRDSE